MRYQKYCCTHFQLWPFTWSWGLCFSAALDLSTVLILIIYSQMGIFILIASLAQCNNINIPNLCDFTSEFLVFYLLINFEILHKKGCSFLFICYFIKKRWQAYVESWALSIYVLNNLPPPNSSLSGITYLELHEILYYGIPP